MIEIRPLTAAVGAEVFGVDFSRPLDVAERATIDAALRDHLVLVFRNTNLDDRRHRDFGAQFGTLESYPLAYQDGADLPELHFIAFDDGSQAVGSRVDAWHTDGSYMQDPPRYTLLRAVVLPEVGGDTCFASMFAAYDALAEPFKRLLDGLTATHDYFKVYQRVIEHADDPDFAARAARISYPIVHHPCVITDEATGRKCLFLNPNYVTQIDGLTRAENNALLPMLFDHVRDPAFQCRVRWSLGDLAMWDNRFTQHYGVPDYRGPRRVNRIVVKG